MSAIEDGGPAFPQIPTVWNESAHKYELGQSLDGMSLRDYFAAKALQAMIGTAATPCMTGLYGGLEVECAKAAYAIADSMLRAREVKA